MHESHHGNAHVCPTEKNRDLLEVVIFECGGDQGAGFLGQRSFGFHIFQPLQFPSSANMNPQMQNLVISLGAMQVARKIPFEDPQVLLYVRAAYVTVQLIILGTYYFVSLKGKRKNGSKEENTER